MSIKAFPLNQTEYSYNAQDVMKYYAGRNSGVFETGENLKVSANGGLEIRVNSGMGWLSRDYVASVAFWNESVEYLMVDAGHDTYDRIDLVVVSWNFVQQEQNPKLIIRKGTPASSPSIPSLVNNSSTIEIALARINVAKGAITLSDSNIVDLRGNDTYCPMVYDEQTIRNAFVNCVGFADGVKKISDFPSITPASSDKILIEQGGEGKSATLADLPIPTSVQRELNTKVNYSDSLSYEEIMATTDLTNKVASAVAVQTIGKNRENWKPFATIAGEARIPEFESKYQSATNYKLFNIEIKSGNEYGAIMFKHGTSNTNYGISMSRAYGVVIIRRTPDGTWQFVDIL